MYSRLRAVFLCPLKGKTMTALVTTIVLIGLAITYASVESTPVRILYMVLGTLNSAVLINELFY